MTVESPLQAPLARGHAPAARRGKRVRRLLIVAALAAVAVGGYFWRTSRNAVPEARPLIVAAVYGSIENSIAAAGTLQPKETVDVGAQVSGQLQKLYVDVGDLVEQGQLLAEIDARVQANRVEASRANLDALVAQLASRESALQLAKANAERQKNLMAQKATSQQDYDSAMNNLEAARSSKTQLEKQIEQSRASLASDETQLGYTKIFAPMSGTVVSIEMNEGVTLNANQTAPKILTIADLSTMTVETQISEADIGKLQRGMTVYFTTLGGGNRRWYSTLRQILPTPTTDNNVVLYTGLFDIDNADGALLPGMTTQVYFVTSSAENVLTVPLAAIRYAEVPNRANIAARTGTRRPSAAGARGAPPADGPGAAFPRGESGRGAGPRSGPSSAEGGGKRRTTGANGAGHRSACVKLLKDDGSIVEKDVVIGLTSRVAAEVVSGLSAGDLVVAGIAEERIEEPARQQGDPRIFRIGGGFRGGFR